MEWRDILLIGLVIVQALTIAVGAIRLSDLEYWVDAHVREHKSH